jgi:hypothetical protein
VQAGLLSREISVFGVPTLSKQAEGNIVGGVMREPWADPARSEIQGMYGSLHAREPGEPMFARPVDRWVGRSGNAEAVRLR